MFNFFESIANLIGFIINFFISAIQMLLTVITQIPVALTFIASAVVYLPAYLKTFALLFVGTCVIFNIINKGDWIYTK